MLNTFNDSIHQSLLAIVSPNETVFIDRYDNRFAGKVDKSGDTMTGSLTVGYVGEGENEDKTRAVRMSGESGVFEVLDGKNKTEYNHGYIREFYGEKERSFLFPSSSGILARLEDVNKSKTELSETIDNVKQELSEDIDNVKQELSEDIAELDYANTIDLFVDPQTYLMTVTLKNPNGETVSESTVDLPLESVVVGGEFDEETSEIVLILENGNEIRFPVSNIVGGFISDKEFEDFLATKGQPNGFASLGADGKVPKEQLPSNIGGGESGEIPDLSEYVKFTDYASQNKPGVVSTIGGAGSGIKVENGIITTYPASKQEIDNTFYYPAITSMNIGYATKHALVYPEKYTIVSPDWTDEEKAAACETIGAANKKYVDDLIAELRAEIVQDVIENGKGEIVQAIIEELQGLPVFGIVDENKIITVTSQLSNGTYKLMYENKDGDYTEVGTITIGNGKVEAVNILPTALTPDDITTIFDGKGYKNGYYASAAEPFYNVDADFFCAGLMVIPEGRTFYIKGCTIDTSLSHTRFGLKNEANRNINCAVLSNWGNNIVFNQLGEQYYSVYITPNDVGTIGIPYYFWFSASGTGDNVFVSTTPIE